MSCFGSLHTSIVQVFDFFPSYLALHLPSGSFSVRPMKRSAPFILELHKQLEWF